MQNDLATKKDLEHLKNEILQTTQTDLQTLKNELLDKLVDKDQHHKDMGKLVTKEEFKQELAKLVTREEFKQELAKLVTREEFKQELAKLVTKDDLKKELSKYATKDDLRFEINAIRSDLTEMDERHTQRYNKILEILDGIAGQLSNNRIEKAASEATFQRHEIMLDNHELRIKQLETARA